MAATASYAPSRHPPRRQTAKQVRRDMPGTAWKHYMQSSQLHRSSGSQQARRAGPGRFRGAPAAKPMEPRHPASLTKSPPTQEPCSARAWCQMKGERDFVSSMVPDYHP
ncbi:Hypothetical predicted protein [Pelobates cultripes]|uniref:Uncharacterized protein n=1 Tax=Pelobates cultripes TaxID=61616 RepID=A0AAD1S171_PELCU|nr:Hypothetical predicted protein [Pelobates cultripes]